MSLLFGSSVLFVYIYHIMKIDKCKNIDANRSDRPIIHNISNIQTNLTTKNLDNNKIQNDEIIIQDIIYNIIDIIDNIIYNIIDNIIDNILDTLILDNAISDTLILDDAIPDTTHNDDAISDTTHNDDAISDTLILDDAISDTLILDDAISDTTHNDDYIDLPNISHTKNTNNIMTCYYWLFNKIN